MLKLWAYWALGEFSFLPKDISSHAGDGDGSTNLPVRGQPALLIHGRPMNHFLELTAQLYFIPLFCGVYLF